MELVCKSRDEQAGIWPEKGIIYLDGCLWGGTGIIYSYNYYYDYWYSYGGAAVYGEVNETLQLTVLNAPPTITYLTPDIERTGANVTFEAVATDPGVYDILTYEWDLDQDGQYDDFSGRSGETTFSETGWHELSVRVSDGDGGYAYGSFDVHVTPEPTSIAIWTLLAVAGMGLVSHRRRK